MPNETYWVEFNDYVMGVPTEEGEKSFSPGDQVELELYSVKSLRFSWFKLIPPPKKRAPRGPNKNKEVEKVNRTKYG